LAEYRAKLFRTTPRRSYKRSPWDFFRAETMPREKSGHRVFDHTADVGLEMWGESAPALFKEAAKALFSLIVEQHSAGAVKQVAIHLGADNQAELFLVWLKELLFLFDTKHLVFYRFEIEKLTATQLKAHVFGEALDPSKHRLGREVKAVTRHGFEFKASKKGCVARVILDI
jgi:SHS2 domain-containing protein